MKNILVFPSVNLEFYLYYNREIGNGYSKIPLDDYKISAGGSSLNIAMALKNAGYEPTLFAFIAANGSSDDYGISSLLLHQLGRLSVANRIFRLLQKDNAAFIDRSDGYNDIIKGYKSNFTNGSEDLIKELLEVAHQYEIKIASGVEAQHINAVNTVFEKGSVNMLIPKNTILKEYGTNLKKIFPDTNIMCIDMKEFQTSGAQYPHEFGLDLLTVTNEEREGFMCFHGQTMAFKPKTHEPTTKIFQVGAGDWFGAALCAFIDRNNIDIKNSNTPVENVYEAVVQASSVASEKILYPNAISGPKF